LYRYHQVFGIRREIPLLKTEKASAHGCARAERWSRRDQSGAGRLTHVSTCPNRQGKVAQLEVGSNATRSRNGKLNEEELLRRDDIRYARFAGVRMTAVAVPGKAAIGQ
jgi:hypothetical protein